MKINDKVKMMCDGKWMSSKDAKEILSENSVDIEIPSDAIGTVVEILGSNDQSDGVPRVRMIGAQFPEGLAYFPESIIKIGLAELIET